MKMRMYTVNNRSDMQHRHPRQNMYRSGIEAGIVTDAMKIQCCTIGMMLLNQKNIGCSCCHRLNI